MYIYIYIYIYIYAKYIIYVYVKCKIKKNMLFIYSCKNMTMQYKNYNKITHL
jgi:hypothetical protein